MKKKFFGTLDWAAFWVATLGSFLVYFLTLGPSLAMEDAGELIVAADHLGVPHPPGYPLWTMLGWVFCRVFSWVTFRGMPNPAWCVALASAVAGALAAGITAMLITRSGQDLLKDLRGDDADALSKDLASHESWGKRFCFVAGVGASLAFAFSPVMWSQSVIVEVYALGALFMMWVLLLTYRWMRQPSDKILWLLAFVFGLGLTNYQVLLLAAIPLVAIVLFRDINLFRDFILVTIPIGLTALLLQIGAMSTADFASTEGFPVVLRHIQGSASTYGVPCQWMVCGGVGLLLAGLLGYVWREHVSRCEAPCVICRNCKKLLEMPMGWPFLVTGVVGFFLLLLGCTMQESVAIADVFPSQIPLVSPTYYAAVAGALILFLTVLFALAMRCRESWAMGEDKHTKLLWILLGVAGVILVIALFAVPTATVLPRGFRGTLYSFKLAWGITLGAIAFMVFLCWGTPRRMCFAVSVAVVQISALLLMNKGVLYGLEDPNTWWFAWPIIWNVVMLILANYCLENGRTVSITVLLAELGVSLYAYMPIVSDLRNPPMNWGYPRTWEGFKHAITRGQYEQIKPTDVFTPRFIEQLGSYFKDVRLQFTLLAAPLALLPFANWKVRGKRQQPVSLLTIGFVLFILCSIVVFVAEVMDCEPTIGLLKGAEPFRVDLLFVGLLSCLGLVGLVVMTLNLFDDLAREALKTLRSINGALLAIMLVGGLLGAGALLGRILAAFWTGGASEFPPGLLYLGIAIGIPLVVAAPVIWGYFRRRVQERFGFALGFSAISTQWFIGTFLFFLVMSVMLIMLANPRGDIQDGFIQKVKFISSHGIVALWMGYGLLFGLFTAHRLLERWRIPCANLIRMAMLVVALAVASIPIWENYMNANLVHAMGAAEQNGHDFGWQFGKYQLMGANGITPELEDDEEPLPNPFFPEEMTPGAIFFGGTDPGRFVPTYMIYSANVRPDVFLITQNALADQTYMSVERDLYGDDMWIPSADDCSNAFSRFLTEVESGKRKSNGAISYVNGRAQISGALGVMEINAMLCEDMFEHNKQVHDFYVEESYAIDWMYPYLSPHGLIMKINSERQRIPQATITADLDFWEWYTRRLTQTPAFRRDLAAQKSFSKLRSAIAGLYIRSGGVPNEVAERAYQESLTLYPISPEALFRYAQEVLLPYRRFDEIYSLISQYNKLDPNNLRGEDFIERVKKIEQANVLISTLDPKFRANTISMQELAQLATAYRNLGIAQMSRAVWRRFAGTPDAGPAEALEGAQQMLEVDVALAWALVKRVPELYYPQMTVDAQVLSASLALAFKDSTIAYKIIRVALQQNPEDWRVQLAAAQLYLSAGNELEAYRTFQLALRLGKADAENYITRTPELYNAFVRLIQKYGQRKVEL